MLSQNNYPLIAYKKISVLVIQMSIYLGLLLVNHLTENMRVDYSKHIDGQFRHVSHLSPDIHQSRTDISCQGEGL